MKLIRCDNPFRPAEGRVEIELASREELVAYLAEHQLSSDDYVLSLNGEIQPPEKLTSLAIAEQDCLVAMPALQNNTLKSIAMIAVAAAAFYFAGPLGAALFPSLSAATATALGGAIISLGGTLLVNGIASLFQKQPGGASYTFEGPQTTARSGIPIPKGYGIMRAAPNVIQSWVDLQHADQDLHDSDDGASDIGRQWLNILCCFGWGPAQSITDIRINEKDISSYADVAYWIHLGTNSQGTVTASDPGWTILNQTTTGSAPNTAPTCDFNRIVNNYPQSQRIRCDITNNFVIFKGQRNDTQRIDVTVQFPRGVWRYDSNMVIKRLDIEYKVWYKLSSATTWTLGQHHVYTNIRQGILRQITTIDGLSAGQYDIKVEKIGAGAHNNPIYAKEYESDYFGDELWLESVQETCYDSLSYPNMILLGLRIMASDQISGANIQITAKVTYNTRVTMPALLSGYGHDNPALVAYDVLTDPLVGGGLSTNNINQEAFKEWADLNVAMVPTGGSYVAAPAAPAPPAGQSVAWSVASLGPAPGSFSTPPTLWNANLGQSGSCSGTQTTGNIAVTNGDSLDTPNGLSLTWGGFIRPPSIPSGATIRKVIPVFVVSSIAPGGSMAISSGVSSAGPVSGTNTLPDVGTWAGITLSASVFNSVPGAASLSIAFSWVALALYYDDPGNTNATTALVPSSAIKTVFNGIFEQGDKTIWDSFSAIGIMSRATPTRIGTQIGVMLDQPDIPVQVFNVGNIFKDSYSKDYLAIEDRANEIEVDFANANDDYKTRNPIRCIPQEEQDAGYAIKKTRVNLLGCTDPVQAYYWGAHKLLENQKLLRTHKWDSPVQAIVCRIGNVVLLQHDVPQYASGGLIVGGTASNPIVDQAFTYASGMTFSVIFPALKRLTGTISGLSGNTFSVAGFSGQAVKRVVSGALDIRITGTTSSTITVDDASALSNGMTVDLYDTEVLVQSGVTAIASSGNQSTLTLATPLPDVPVADSPYILATVSSQPKQVRIRGIKRNGEQKFAITALDYDPAVYDIPLPDDLLPTTSGGSAGNSASTADPTTTPPAAPPTDVLSTGDPGYGGSTIPAAGNSYTQSPQLALSQPSSTSIALAAVTVTYANGTSTSYSTHTFTIADPGSSPTWYYVTVDGSGTFYCENTAAKVGVLGYTYLGALLATHAGGAHSANTPGGWPIPGIIEAVS